MRLTRRAFLRLVQQALEELPSQVLDVLDNASLVVEEWPTEAQLETHDIQDRYGLLGLYEGVPLVDRQHYTLVLPDKITLFQRPLESACASTDELLLQVKATIVHEIAHHLGWSDEALERMGYT